MLSRFVDAIMIRTDDHAKAEELARPCDVPVINGLTDLSHPCQILADMQTVIERGRSWPGRSWAWLGDGNNVCNSLIEAAALMHFELAVATAQRVRARRRDARPGERRATASTSADDPREAVAAPRWSSPIPGSRWARTASEYRREAFARFQVDEALMALAAPDAIFLHCLPAHRGEEVTDAVIDGPQSAVWDEAENRLHAQKALLLWAMGKLG